MQILGYAIGEHCIVTSDNKMAESNVLDFLSEQKQDTIRIIYNLNSGVCNLINMLKLNQYQVGTLYKTTYLKLPEYTLRFIPDRLLSIRKNGLINTITYYSDASQYNVFVTQDLIVQARVAKDIGEEVYKYLKAIGLEPTSLTSPIRCFEKDVLSKLDICTDSDMPKEALMYADKCLENEYGLLIISGNDYVDQIDNDTIIKELINGISYCMDIRYGTWWHRTNLDNELVSQYGYYKVKYENIDMYLTKETIEFNRQHDDKQLVFIDGWEFYPDKKVLPYAEVVSNLKNLWVLASGGLSKKLLESIIVGIYEKMLENKSKQNTVWATQIENGMRLALMKKQLESIV